MEFAISTVEQQKQGGGKSAFPDSYSGAFWSEYDRIKMSRVKTILVKKTGTSHQLQDLPCQDAVSGRKGPSACAVALSDGAGSVYQSEKVSFAAAEAAADEFGTHYIEDFNLPEEILRERILRKTRDATREEAPAIEAACTLLVAAMWENDGNYPAIPGNRHLICCHLGDGYIFGIDRNDSVSVLSYPQNGDFVNETYFLSDWNATYRLHIIREYDTDLKGLLLCSDGTGVSLYDPATHEIAPAVGIMFHWLETYDEEPVAAAIERELERSLQRNSDDDMSIAMMIFS